jgi:ParB family chromosome partitioning protein
MSTTKRKALGKGLKSLIRDKPPATSPTAQARPKSGSPGRGDGLLNLDLDLIRPNPNQPRTAFDQEALDELARSMKQEGVLQPVIVREIGEGKYELVAGERRWRAAQIAGLLKVPALVKQVADERLLEVALIENLQREELNPMEAAVGFQTLIDDLGLTQQEVAERVGKQRATVSNMLRLLNLPREVQDRIRSGEVSTGHAKALASLGNPGLQKRLAERIAREDLSVRQVEAIVKRTLQTRSASVSTTKATTRDPNVVAAEEALQRALGAKVSILQAPGKKGGRLEIHFHDDDELERVYQIVLRAAQRASRPADKNVGRDRGADKFVGGP